jgi:transposase
MADLCAREQIAFILGHALYMKAIHGGKAKNDKIDAHKIAGLMRCGMFPQAYVYPSEMRSTRDLLQRRMYLVRQRTDLLTHIHNTNSQYNFPAIGQPITRKKNRGGVTERFTDPQVQKTVAVDFGLIEYLDQAIHNLEPTITRLERARSGCLQAVALRAWHRRDLGVGGSVRDPRDSALTHGTELRLV